MKLYKIKNWSEMYENNRTRELKHLAWFPMSNKQDGDGYTLLMDHKNGAALYGAWIATLQVASRCDPRGTLVRDCDLPHNSVSLSRMTRVPEGTISEMLEVCEKECGWITFEGSNDNPASECENPAPSCGNPAPQCLERKKERKNEHTPEKEGFKTFWSSYPRKVSKEDARKAWNQNSCEEKLVDILRTLELQKRLPDWIKDGGQFIPYPASWLNKKRWEDDLAAPKLVAPSRPSFADIDAAQRKIALESQATLEVAQ